MPERTDVHLPARDAVDDLLQLAAPLGVVTVVASTDPGNRETARQRAHGALRSLRDAHGMGASGDSSGSGTAEVGSQAAAGGGATATAVRTTETSNGDGAAGSRAQRRAVELVVKRAERSLDELLDHVDGRGVVGFLVPDADAREVDERWFAVAMQPDTEADATLGATPLVAPLVAAIAPCTGVACLDGEHLRVLESSAGEPVHEVVHMTREADTEDWRRMAGPAGGGRARSGHRAQNSATQVDRFARRVAEQRRDFLREAFAPAVATLADSRGWERLVVIGPQEAREAAAGATGPDVDVIDGGGAEVVREPLGDLQARVQQIIDGDEERRTHALVDELLERLDSGTGAAGGVEAIEFLVGQARVERLVLDGACATRPEVDALVRGAIGSGARISVVHGDAAERLAPHEGVVARLRW